MKLKFLLLAGFILIVSCSKDDGNNGVDVNLNSFEAISEQYPYSGLNPDNPTDYFEIVNKFEESTILFSYGTICANNTDENCADEFHNLTSDSGYHVGCLPSYCITFLRYQSGSQNSIVDSKEDLKEFLGDIDSKSDALLWAYANNYYFALNDIENGAIKQVDGGYKLIALKLVSDCTPYQVNRFLLKISTDGEISIEAEEVQTLEENVCV